MSNLAETRTGPADVAYKPRGIGTPGQTFLCGACGNFRGLLGRKLRRVRGLKTWVCGGCAK